MEDLWLFCFGLATGSFLNTCIDRLPQQESLLQPRSHCPHCGRVLKPVELFPVLGWMLLGGRCRSCRARISGRYPGVELLAAFVALLLYQTAGFGLDFICTYIFACLLIGIAIIDYRQGIIFDKSVLLLAAGGMAVNSWNGQYAPLDLLAGSLLGGGFLLALLLLTRGGLGGGDIKFAAALGFWLGWEKSIVLLVLAFWAGGLAGGTLLLCGRKQCGDAMAFGPFLSAAAFVAYLYGDSLIQMYWRAFL